MGDATSDEGGNQGGVLGTAGLGDENPSRTREFPLMAPGHDGATLAGRIDGLAGSLAEVRSHTAKQLASVQSEVEGALERVEDKAQQAIAHGSVMAEAAGVIQAIVDFLHHLFPGHAMLPGTPSHLRDDPPA